MCTYVNNTHTDFLCYRVSLKMVYFEGNVQGDVNYTTVQHRLAFFSQKCNFGELYIINI